MKIPRLVGGRRQLAAVAPVEQHRVDLGFSIGLFPGCECDPLTIRRDRRVARPFVRVRWQTFDLRKALAGRTALERYRAKAQLSVLVVSPDLEHDERRRSIGALSDRRVDGAERPWGQLT